MLSTRLISHFLLALSAAAAFGATPSSAPAQAGRAITLEPKLQLPAPVLLDQEDKAAVEQLVSGYISSYFKGDMIKAAELTHPQTMADFREVFFRELANAQARDQEVSYLASFGSRKSLSQLKALNDKELYIELIGAYRIKAGEIPEEARLVSVADITSVRQEGGERRVSFNVIMPSKVGDLSEPSALIVALTPSGWKVRDNAP